MRTKFAKRFTLNVQHDEEQQQFIVPLRPEPAVVSYEENNNTWLITDVQIDQHAQQFHIGPRLMEYVLEMAAFHKISVKPGCSYAENYIARNPRFEALLAE